MFVARITRPDDSVFFESSPCEQLENAWDLSLDPLLDVTFAMTPRPSNDEAWGWYVDHLLLEKPGTIQMRDWTLTIEQIE